MSLSAAGARRRTTRARRLVAVGLVSAVAGLGAALTVTGATPPAAAETSPLGDYRPPVDARPVDRFRPPPGPYGAGNRGWAYDLPAGTVVHAAGAGRVAFAGPVGGRLVVSIDHPDGLRTTYTNLSAIDVRVGALLVTGTPVGRAGAGFHFGVRDGPTYLDPARLFAPADLGAGWVRLVPGRPETTSSRRGVLDRAAGAYRWLVGHSLARLPPPLLGAGPLPPVPFSVVRAGPGIAADVAAALADVDCTAAGVAPPPPPRGRRRAVLVGGLGSSASTAAIDDLATRTLGYDDIDVVRFSYAGGRIPQVPGRRRGGSFLDLPASTYDPADTVGDLLAQARALADLLARAVARAGGDPVDVFAHSQGGIVLRLALDVLSHRPGGATTLAGLGLVVTLGTPHGGAALAGQIDDIDAHALAALGGVAGLLRLGIDPASPWLRQLAPGSDLIRRLQTLVIPPGVRFLAIGAAGDLVVPGTASTVRGQPGALVGLYGPSAHGDLPGHRRTTQQLLLALDGRPPTCDGVARRVAHALVGHYVGIVTDQLIEATS